MNLRAKRLIKIISVIVVLIFLCLIVGKGISEQEKKQVQYSMYYKYYEEKKPYNDWIDSLLTATQSEDYAYALVWVEDENADFSWKSCDDREALVEAFAEEKENIPQRDENADLWYYIKLRLNEDIHGIDIYEYLEQNLPEEGDERYAHTLEGGCAYYIAQGYREEIIEGGQYRWWPKREVVICDGYLYFLACNAVTEENRERVDEQMEQFHSFFEYSTPFSYHGSNHFMDVEILYWIDHEERVTELENPKCRFLEKRQKI